MTEISAKELETRRKLKDNYPLYAKKCLIIRTKTQGNQPFNFTKTQQYIHSKVEEQKKTTGKVRALVLKGRQTKCSTYVEGRFYHLTTHGKGKRAFILTHEDDATKNLFEMADRFHKNIRPDLRPHTGKSNEKELYFDKLDSGYRVATARTKGTGRSGTVQYFHGSEVAFWPNADSHAAGVMQSIPDAEGTEVFLETTGNGVGGYFHALWQDAVRGLNEYIPIFVPWFWEDEYRKTPPEDFSLSDEEREYKDLYKLDDDQIYWRRMKIAELRDPLLFKQEYPATPEEAFQSTGTNPFINQEAIIKARQYKVPFQDQNLAPIVCGCDPARLGKDRCAFIFRQGRVAYNIETYEKRTTVQVANRCREILDVTGERMVIKLYLDIGYMPGVYDLLVDWGYEDRVVGVNFGGAADDPDRYLNKRAEMYDREKEWIEDDTFQVSIPDSDELHADMGAPGFDRDTKYRLKIESKKDMEGRGIRSPDVNDALALTFYELIIQSKEKHSQTRRQQYADTDYDLFR